MASGSRRCWSIRSCRSRCPRSQPLPSDYEKIFSEIGIARIRRGPLSATLALGGSSRVLSLRYGDAVVEGVRFATSFFGKGQFVPVTGAKEGSAYLFRQSLEAPYYQPLARTITPGHVGADAARAAPDRDQSPRAGRRGHRNEVRVSGSREGHGHGGVPLAVEIAFRDGGRLEGCTAVPGTPGSYVLEGGSGVYRAGKNEIRFGPGGAPHRYVQLRGAEPKLPGESVYITGFTPFDQTLTFECS